MIVEKLSVAHIPMLHIYNETMTKETPVTIFLHGFTSAKEHNLHYAYNLVESGVRVLLPEANYHGERAQQLTEKQLSFKFWEIVFTSIKEVGMIQQWLLQNGYSQKIAIAGTSMGAITTVGCLKMYDWIRAAGVLMGVTNYNAFFEMQLAQFKKIGIELPLPEAAVVEMKKQLQQVDGYTDTAFLTKVPVYMWHGAKDATVPASLTKDYTAFLADQNVSHEITYELDPRAGHAVSRQALLKCTTFIAQHLA